MTQNDNNDAMAKLHGMLGEWHGDETANLGWRQGPGFQSKTVVSNVMTVGGWGILHDHLQVVEDKHRFHTHAVFQFDPLSEDYLLDWFGSSGRTSFRGRLENGVLEMLHRGPKQWIYTEYDLTTPDQLKMSTEYRDLRGDWQPVLQGVFARSGAAKASEKPAESADETAPDAEDAA